MTEHSDITGGGPEILDDQPDQDYTEQAVTAMLAAVAASDGGGAPDFAEWLSHVLAQVAAMSGGVEAVLAGRPGSWEADKVRDFVLATAGDRPGDLEAFLPDGFRVPLGSVALYESADNTLWLVTRPWDGDIDQPATVYVRHAALHPDEDIYADGYAWLVEQTGIVTAKDSFRWRELGADERTVAVAALLAHEAGRHTTDPADGAPAPSRLLGTLYRDRAASISGVWFDVADRDYLASRPLAVQRYCNTLEAEDLETAEAEAISVVLDELAVLAGELDAGDYGDGITLGSYGEDRHEVTMHYALALGLARNDDAAYTRAQQLKAEYEAWWTRWHILYTDAQPEGVTPMGL